MPKVFTGEFGKETVQSNSFTENLLKYPEILKDYVTQDKKWITPKLLEGLGRVESRDIQGQKVEWYLQTRTKKLSTCTGTVTGDGTGNTPVQVEFYENWFNPNDVAVFGDGTQGVIIGEPTQTATGWLYNIRFKFDNGSATATFDSATLAANGSTAGKLTSNFPEGSDKGYGTTAYPDKYVNWTSIKRDELTLTGNALTDVTWLEQGGQRMWMYTKVKEKMDNFLNEMEAERWYGKRSQTVAATGEATPFIPDADGKYIYSGDGIHEQIATANIDTYNGANLTQDTIIDFMQQLKISDGAQESDEYVVVGGSAAKAAFFRAMREHINEGRSVLYDVDEGKHVEVGYDVTTFTGPFGRLHFAWNPVYDDRTLGMNDLAADGQRQESYRMTWLNFGLNDGISNVEVITNAAHGINRGMIVKYISGMVDPYKPNSMYASNSKDSFTCEVLAETSVIIKDPLACGMMIYA